MLLFWSTTAAFRESLLPIAGGSAMVVAGAIFYRLAWVVAYILISNVLTVAEASNDMEKFAQRGLVGKMLSFATLLLSVCIRLVAVCAQALLSMIYLLLPVVFFSLIIAQMNGRWVDTILFADASFNTDSQLASTLRNIVTVPLDILQRIALFVIPAYNLIVYCIFHVPLSIVTEFFVGSGGGLVLGALQATGQAFPALFEAIKAYVQSNPVRCGDDACLSPDLRRLHTEASFELLRKGATMGLQAGAMGCESLADVSNAVFYPFTDASAWRAAGELLNAVLYVLVGMPTTTAARCAMGGACSPDVAPAFDFLVRASTQIGKLVDNWLAMVYLLIFYGANTPCPVGQQDIGSVWGDPIAKAMFGSNSTVVVRLTPTLFAVTDGYGVMHIDHKTDVRRSYAPGVWLAGINPLFGVASVITPAGDRGMMGCSCVDQSERAVIMCTILTAGGTNQAWSSEVTWEIPSSPQYLRCSNLRVLVQSVRWPVHRMQYNERISQLNAEGLVIPCFSSAAGCATVDAMVYAIPSCGGGVANTVANMGCLDAERFTMGNCYPYCMGVHMVNTPAQPLIMRGAKTWGEGALLTQRDCAVPSTLQKRTGGGVGVTTACANDAQITTSTAPAACAYKYECSSFVYLNGTTQAQNAFAMTTDRVELVMQGQPIAVAGATFMRLYKDKTDMQYYVDFPTLTGSQYNEMSMEVGTPAGIPATDPPAVIALTSQTIKKGYITLPPNDVPMPVIYNPATVDSSNRMWYAVNPSYTWIQGFSVWCETNGNDVQLQVMLPTNYAAISIWRVKYSGGACTIDMMGTHVCTNDVAVMIPLDITNNMPTLGRANGGKETKLSARLCSTSVKFNLWVEQLEYFDDLNIVATVRRGSVKTLASLLWVQDKRDQGVLVHYFINTLNVSQVREGTPWQADEQAVCPALRFLPSVGTFIAKSLESSVQLIRMPINVLMNPPAVESLLRFRASGQCPAETHGHSAYANCGNGLLALDPYFEALYAANEAFWGIVAWVAAQITLPDANAQTEFAKFLTGVATISSALSCSALAMLSAACMVRCAFSFVSYSAPSGIVMSSTRASRINVISCMSNKDAGTSASRKLSVVAVPFVDTELSDVSEHSDFVRTSIGSSKISPAICISSITLIALLTICTVIVRSIKGSSATVIVRSFKGSSATVIVRSFKGSSATVIVRSFKGSSATVIVRASSIVLIA